MFLSLKKSLVGLIVVALLSSTYSFSAMALSLDTMINVNEKIYSEKNKNNHTKYYDFLLNESKQFLMNDEENSVNATTTFDDIKNNNTTTENKNENKDNKENSNLTNTENNEEPKEDEANNKKENEDSKIENKNSNTETNNNTSNDTNNNDNTNENSNKNTENDDTKNTENDKVNTENTEQEKVEVVVDDDVIEDDKTDSIVSDTPVLNDAVDNLNDNGDANNEQVDVEDDADMDTATDSEAAIFGDQTIQYIWFGLYPQNDETGAELEPIKWKILSQDDSEALLISDSVLDKKTADGGHYGAIFWEDYDIRAWLNNEFINKAWNEKQRNVILTKLIKTRSCDDTNDQVFFLSTPEAKSLFADDSERMAQKTNYSKTSYWWLRECGYYSNLAMYVKRSGAIDEIGRDIELEYCGVRPALYINLSADNFKSQNNQVTWDKSSGWEFKSTSILWDSYDKYVGGQSLPSNNNLVEIDGMLLKGWRINDSETIYTEIPVNQTGDIKLTPVFGEDTTEYDIHWDLGEGKFKDEYKYLETAKHTTKEDFNLPSEEALDIPYAKIFKNWTVDGVATTSISKNIHKAVTVTANIVRSSYNYETYSIGSYVQDEDEATDLEWIVLDKKDGNLLLTTKNIIDTKAYDNNGKTEFNHSSLKQWLNNEFYNTAFTKEQQNKLLDVTLADNEKVKVFLLNYLELAEYYPEPMDRITKATKHVLEVDNNGETLEAKSGNIASYWLMTLGDENLAPYVSYDGEINEVGASANTNSIGVRPCIWVSEKEIKDIRVIDLNKVFSLGKDALEVFYNCWDLLFGKSKK